jgi:PAS domain S-box-containing protein
MDSPNQHSQDQHSQDQLRNALVTELDALYKEIAQLTRVNAVSTDHLQLLRGLVSVSQFAAQQAAQAQNTGGALIAETTQLQQDVERLRIENEAYSRQLLWLKDRMALSRTSTGKLMLKTSLKQTLDAAVEITRAGNGSIFLLNPERVVTESILAGRPGTTEDDRRTLVGKVLEKGLAAWVAANRTVALINDTMLDERWVNLPEQPYKVNSALCVPILHQDDLLGMLTLTHPERRHFTLQDSDLVQAITYQVGLVLENTRLNDNNKDLKDRLQSSQDYFRQLLKTPLVGACLLQDNKLLHVNDKLAELLGYSREELLKLPSIASLLAYEDREATTLALHQCLAGKSAMFNITFRMNQKQGNLLKVMAQGITSEYQGRLAVVALINEVD